MTNLLLESSVLAITESVKMLSSPDPLVAAIARASADRRVRMYREGGKRAWNSTTPVSNQDLCDFLSGRAVNGRTTASPGVQDVWTRARRGFARLGFSIHPSGGELLVVKMGQRSVANNNLKRLTKFLHQSAGEGWRDVWKNKRAQGRTVESHSQKPHSSAWLSRSVGNISESDKAWAIKARLNLLPTLLARSHYAKVPRGFKPPTLCRVCQNGVESSAHILNSCQPMQESWVTRHDAVVRLIANNVPSSTTRRITIDQMDELAYRHGVEGALGRELKPDLVVVQQPQHASTGGLEGMRANLTILDVAVPYEKDGALDLRQAQKIAKYTPLKQLYEDHHPQLQGEVHAFPVGSLGSIHGSCFGALRRLGFPRQRAHEVMRKASVLAIQGSRRLWSRWCQMLYRLPPERQNPPPVPI